MERFATQTQFLQIQIKNLMQPTKITIKEQHSSVRMRGHTLQKIETNTIISLWKRY